MPTISTLNRPPRSHDAVGDDSRSRRTIVIAVDGRPPSIAALTWARDSLIQPDDRIRIVTAYTSPLIASEVPIRTEDLVEAHDHARRAARDAVQLVFGSRHADAVVDHVVALGPIERVLDTHAAEATLVVVGTRPRRRWRERLRGSTTNRVTGRLNCPVISIPETLLDGRSPAHPASRAPRPSDTS
jgi:nucleotide-binding universal stress UspA family protein